MTGHSVPHYSWYHLWGQVMEQLAAEALDEGGYQIDELQSS